MLHPMKISITGANGFIGRKLVGALSRENHAISVLSRHSNLKLPAGVRVVKGDLTQIDCPLDHLLEDCEVVFHCAGESRNEAAMRPLHVDGTLRLLDAVRRKASQRKETIHWVQLSSVGAYGPPQLSANIDRVVAEDTPTRPLREYEITKTLSDELVIEAGKSGLMTYSILRPSKVFGADMPDQSLRLLGTLVRRGLFFYVGPPGALATYVHVDDVVEALVRCGSDCRAKGKIFNISNDCLLEEMVDSIASALGVARPWLRLPESTVRLATYYISKFSRIPLTQARINGLVSRTRYPCLKLEQELGFSPRISVPETIGEVVLAQ